MDEKVEELKKIKEGMWVRDAKEDEKEGSYVLMPKPEISEKECQVIGRFVTEDILEHYKLRLLKEYKYTKLDEKSNKLKTYLFTSRESYPIFSLEGEGFNKILKPKEKDKAFRFLYTGTKPLDWIWGLQQILTNFELGITKKKDKVILCSGDRDAMNVASAGYDVIWLNSETATLSQDKMEELKFLTEELCYLPDIDETGKKMAKLLGEKYPEIKIVWLPESLKEIKDWRGNPCKDVTDYLQYNTIQDLRKLVNCALPSSIRFPEIDMYDTAEFSEVVVNLLKDKNKRMQNLAIESICEKIVNEDAEMMEDEWIEAVVEAGVKKSVLTKKLKEIKKSKKAIQLKTDDKLTEILEKQNKEIQEFGFWQDNNSYHFVTKDGIFKGSNFTIEPIFHIVSKTDDKRLIKVKNEFGFEKMVDIPSKSFISLDQFQMFIYTQGNFLFFGQKMHYMKILNKISNQFSECNEMKTLGQQREGFWAFANGILDKLGYKENDEFGIIEHERVKYFLPAFSKIYSGLREDDDAYESDRQFVYKKCKISFKEWTALMVRVYEDNGKIGVAFLIAAIFRDIIYDKYKIFPHLFLVGPTQTGKSQLAWSLQNIFLNNVPPFNLSTGTNVAFFRKLSRIKNAIQWFDEYDNMIDDKRFQALKAAYDGAGHEKGKMSADSRTDVTKVNSACVISGQYFPTRDDNALFNRSIMLSFYEREFDVEAFNEMKEIEKEGMSSLIEEIYKFRNEIEKEFVDIFGKIFSKLKQELMDGGVRFQERVVRNFATILTPIKIIQQCIDKLDMAFEYEDLYKLSKQCIIDMTKQLQGSHSLSNFWLTVEWLLDQGKIKEGFDFIIETKTDITVGEKGAEESRFVNENKAPGQVLFIRLTRIHPEYLTAHRQQTGLNGIDLTSLLHYIKHSKVYLGRQQSHRFKRQEKIDGVLIDKEMITSCLVLRYDEELLGVNLERRSAELFDSPSKAIEKTELPF